MASENRRAGLRNWKVIFWSDQDGVPKRYVFGKREAARAWSLYWAAKKKGHLSAVSLWRGKQQLL